MSWGCPHKKPISGLQSGGDADLKQSRDNGLEFVKTPGLSKIVMIFISQ